MNVCAHGTRWLAAAACLALCVSFRLAAADPLPSPSFGQIPLTFEPNRVRPIDRTRVRMTLAGAQPSPVARGVDEQPGRVSYLVGRDPRDWRSAGTSVIINGANFTAATAVTFNGPGASYVVNSESRSRRWCRRERRRGRSR